MFLCPKWFDPLCTLQATTYKTLCAQSTLCHSCLLPNSKSAPHLTQGMEFCSNKGSPVLDWILYWLNNIIFCVLFLKVIWQKLTHIQ